MWIVLRQDPYGVSAAWTPHHLGRAESAYLGRFSQVVRTSSDAAFGGLPLFGCGISLGGCVLVSAAHQVPDAFSGVVLLAPMLSLEKMKADPINAVLRPFASLLAWLVPSLPIVAIPRNTMFPLIQVHVCVCVLRIASPPLSLVGS